jgi:acetyltransferase
LSYLEPLLNPKSIAVVGATERDGSVGRTLIENCLLGLEERKVYPVNPAHETVLGQKCYPDMASVPKPVDLAIIATPAWTVPDVVEECGKAGVPGVVIVAAGFKETGQAGRDLEAKISEIRVRYGMRIIGPNCLGIIRPHANLNATFLRHNPPPGRIAFISQSGALGSAILDWAVSENVGFSAFLSVGSMLDVDFGDLIDFLGEDSYTGSIIIYMESVGNARRFMRAARGFARSKPIVVIKPGKYAESAKAALSHTGAMAGSYEVYNAAFRRAGIVRVDEILDLFNCASVLDSRYLPAGPRIALITNAGGPGVLAADAIIESGCELARLSEETLKDFDESLPPYWSHGNPVDLLGDADVERYAKAISGCLADRAVDGIVVVYTPQGSARSTELAERVVKVAERRVKPILTVWMGEQGVTEGREVFHSKNIPTYDSPEQAIKTYQYMWTNKRNLDLLNETPEDLSVALSPPSSHVQLLMERSLQAGQIVLTEDKADRFLDAYGIPRARGVFCENVEQAVPAAASIGYPVVLKVVSPDIIHKSDAGAVVPNLRSEAELREVYPRVLERVHETSPAAKIEGAYVQKMIENVNYELILGSKKDLDFGAVIMFGAGGTAVEMYHDISVKLPPLNQTLARLLMEDTRVWQVLKNGFRSKPPADLRLLEEIVVKFSNLVVDFPDIAEIDVNPLVVTDSGVYAVDSRIVLDSEPPASTDPHRHLVIMPYPGKYITPWRLRDGTDVILRPIRPEDEPLEAELLRGLSDETSRFRFFQVMRNITHEVLIGYCNIDYDREMAIIAELTEGGKKRSIGVSRLIMEPGDKRAEFAVLVADDFAGQGLGTKLVDMLIGIGEEKRLETIYGIVLADNANMIRLCRSLGFEVKRGESAQEVIVELRLASRAS